VKKKPTFREKIVIMKKLDELHHIMKVKREGDCHVKT